MSAIIPWWNASRDALVRTLAAQGATAGEIARALNRGSDHKVTAQTVYSYCARGARPRIRLKGRYTRLLEETLKARGRRPPKRPGREDPIKDCLWRAARTPLWAACRECPSWRAYVKGEREASPCPECNEARCAYFRGEPAKGSRRSPLRSQCEKCGGRATIWPPSTTYRDVPRRALAVASKPGTSRLFAIYLKSLAICPAYPLSCVPKSPYIPCEKCLTDWTEKHKERIRCLARKVGRAGRRGLAKKPTQCAQCGRYVPDELEAHHRDIMEDPLDVVWLCKHCHHGTWWPAVRRRRTRKRRMRPGRSGWAERKKITPAAVRLAAEVGIDYLTVKGTGAGGRILKRDVRRAVEARKRKQLREGGA